MTRDALNQWIDVSIPMRKGMTVWPGDMPFQMEPASRITNGDGCNVSRLALSTHTGTHVDAPWHFEERGRKLHQVDPSIFFGDAQLRDVSDQEKISAPAFGEIPLPKRLLLKTRNSEIPTEGPLYTGYTALEPDAAQRLVDEGVRLVGVDYLSVAPYQQPGQATHHILLRNNVLIVEGLRLKGLRPGVYEFVVLPLPISDADGAPCRAFLRRGENTS
ncbi:MAG: cyclase family protein [Candidatus Hydrogenedentes bacterium]|nr:cyclase family protein [Candidatus Hydrogenedentota bacterium]